MELQNVIPINGHIHAVQQKEKVVVITFSNIGFKIMFVFRNKKLDVLCGYSSDYYKKKAGCAGIRQIIISGDYIDSFNCHRYGTIDYQLKLDINQTLQDQDRRVLVRLIPARTI